MQEVKATYHFLGTAPRDIQSHWCRFKWYIVAIILSSIITCGMTLHAMKQNYSADILQLHNTVQKFQYNHTYGDGTMESDEAWETLFPAQGGFFQHPLIAPQRSGFSHYHQLHCLDGIRRSYWLVYNAAQANTDVEFTAVDHMLRPPHIRHCIDFLRQSLMCQPDLTVEPVDPIIKASKGFGVAHQCKDYQQLREFMGHWERRDFDWTE